MRALVLLLGLAAHAEEVPESGAATPEAPATADAPRDVLVVTSEVDGRGNDATARALEAMVKARGDAILACRTVPATGEAPLRFLQLFVQVRPADGWVKKLAVTSSTGDERVDACVSDLVSALVWDPPPTFADKLQLNVTWRAPLPPP